MVCRLSAANALQHPTRARLHAIVQADPGISFRAAVAHSGVALGTARHHLSILKRAGLVCEHRVGVRVAFLPAGDGRDAARLAMLRGEGMRELRDRIAGMARATQKDVLNAVPWSRSTTQHRLGRLVAAGILRTTWRGRYRHYEVVEAGA